MKIGNLRRKILVIILLFCSFSAYGQDGIEDSNTEIKFSHLFYNLGPNLLHSFTYNYGMNYLVSGLGTYYMVHTGIDWEWRKIFENNKTLSYCGLPFGAFGFIIPVAVPLGMYLYGNSKERSDIQVVGLALGQAAMFGWVISSSIKTFTGRMHPHLFFSSGTKKTTDFSNEFAFGFMERGIWDGWPSSHTAVATAMAIALAELYPENIPLKIAAYSYSIITGVGMSTFGHWASDSAAGFLIGISIGKSVGRGFKELMNKQNEANRDAAVSGISNRLPGFNLNENITFYVLPNSIGISILFL